MLRDEPGQLWPALEVDDVVLALLFGQPTSSSLAGESHIDAQGTEEETNLLPSRVLEKGKEEEESNFQHFT